MSKVLSDQEIYSALETVVSTIYQNLATHRKSSSFPDQEILQTLQQQGYNQRTSWAFLRACYWHLVDTQAMVVNPSCSYHLTKELSKEAKAELCRDIFSEYAAYLTANYACSLTEPDPYHHLETAPDSSSGERTRPMSAGK